MNIDHDTLIAYAMGILSEQEMLNVEKHLRTSPDDALEVKRYLNAFSAVVMTEEPEVLPIGAEQDLLSRIRAEGDTKQTLQTSQLAEKREATEKQEVSEKTKDSNIIRLEPQESRQKYQWGLGFAVAASLAAFAFYGPFSSWYGSVQVNQELAESIKKPGATSTALANDSGESIGTLVKQEDNSLLVVLTEELSDEQVYQAWNIIDGQPQSMGIYAAGIIQVSGFESGNIFGVTIEPAGGSEQPTSTPIVIYEL